MTTTDELKTELNRIKKIIQNRIEEANKSQLPGKIQKVAEIFGEKSDWGGGTYYYYGKKLHIEYSYHNQKYLKVTSGNKKLFTGTLHQNGVADISLYIPGEWEKEIEKLHIKIPYVEEKRETEKLQNQITELKEVWQLEV